LRVKPWVIPVAVAAAGLSLAGCALSTGELRDVAAAQPVLSNAGPAAGVEATPAVLVEQGPAESPGALATAEALPPLPKGTTDPRQTASIAAGQPAAKVMSPEEKARVIAELEALARGQSVAPPPPPQPAFCSDPAAKLDPAQRLACDPKAPKPALRP
jgi:hypothetical protein